MHLKKVNLHPEQYPTRQYYFLDKPETALSPKSQLELLNLLKDMGRSGHALILEDDHIIKLLPSQFPALS